MTGKTIKIITGIVFSVVVFANPSHAQSFCFASATTYYEQVYCELQARGEAKNLPPFYQFKRNDATTQALLLKRPAARINIDLPMPKSSAKTPPQSERKIPPVVSTSAPPQPSQSPPVTFEPTPPRVGVQTGCHFDDAAILCGVQRFQLTGNRRNQRLAAGVLEAENRMALPVYGGKSTDQAAVDVYLAQAYRQYIEKMHEIGLGGVTMTYGKFYFLFFDLQEKGLDFSQRFETMYGFLKKDKATMGVSETLTPDSQLKVDDCDLLADHLLVCSRSGRNYLYVAMSE